LCSGVCTRILCVHARVCVRVCVRVSMVLQLTTPWVLEYMGLLL